MDLSIIIVTWNSRNYLLDALESIYASALSLSFEIIVVDNGSSDGTAEAVQERYPEVKLIETGSNTGFAFANNIGIIKSSGRYVCLMNPDALINPGCLEKLVSKMDEDGRIGLIGPKILNTDLTLQLSARRFPSLGRSFFTAVGGDRFIRSLNYFDHTVEGEVEHLSGCLIVARRAAVATVGLLDDGFFMYSEDKDWCKRFIDSGWKVVYFPAASAVHHGGGSSSNAPVRFYLEMQMANVRYWKKHHGRVANVCFLGILLFHHAMRITRAYVFSFALRSRSAEDEQALKRSMAFVEWALTGREAGRGA